MNENLNLVEILKDCPQGTKLYSTIHGEVEFEKYKTDGDYPIVYNYRSKTGGLQSDSVTRDGRFNFCSYGECILFPSKDQRDWSKFKVEPEMVEGEVYYCSLFNRHNAIYIHRKTTSFKTEYYAKLDLCDLGLLVNGIITTNEENIKELRKATKEEEQQLLNTIKRGSYKWDKDKKELVRLEPKFDINTLKPFDKVLGRDKNSSVWRCDFFSHIGDKYCKFICTGIGNNYAQCIPYNDETKHLINTTEIPPDKYITWGKQL